MMNCEITAWGDFFPEEKNKLGTFLNSLGWMQCTSEKRLLGHVCLLVGNYFSDELKWVIPRYTPEELRRSFVCYSLISMKFLTLSNYHFPWF